MSYVIKDAINSAIDRLKKLRLDKDYITTFPQGVWALDKEGNVLQNLNDNELNKWVILVIMDEKAYREFYELNWNHLMYPSFDCLHSISLNPHLRSGIYYAVFDSRWDTYEFIDITKPIQALKIANLL